jgi:ABC-type dipeptide/oligopeptide/nickel transport system ATPase component
VGASYFDESKAREALTLIGELDTVSLPRFRVIGSYVRYDEGVRNLLKDMKQKIVDGLQAHTKGQENYLIWGPPGSGKSYFVQQIANSLDSVTCYRELNLAQLDEQGFRSGLTQLEKVDRPLLCFVDEIDSKPSDPWPYEVLIPQLEPLTLRAVRTCFILAGSSGSDISEMKKRISLRQKGIDLLNRIPNGNECVVPSLSVGDKILVALCQLTKAAKELDFEVREVEKLALCYIALNSRLSSARQLRELAVNCVRRMPKGEDRVKYDYLFSAGDPENKEFWQKWLGEGLVNSFIIVEDDQTSARAAYPEVMKDLPARLKLYVVDESDFDFQKISEVYVKPLKYHEAWKIIERQREEQREAARRIVERKQKGEVKDQKEPREGAILIITGPAHVGKTAMATYLSLELKTASYANRILKFSTPISVDELKNVKESVIFLDDAFGATEFRESFVGDRFPRMEEMKDAGNYIIITSRREVLDEALKITKLGEISDSSIAGYLVEMEQEGDYDDALLSAILKKHVDYYGKYGMIDEKQVSLVKEFHTQILKSLRFPHNYEIFVRDELPRTGDGETMKEAIDNAIHIENAVRKWFLRFYRKDYERFLFLVTLGLFNDVDEVSFADVYAEIFRALATKSEFVPPAHPTRKDVFPYVSASGNVRFKHPSYWEGVMKGISEIYVEEVAKLIPFLESCVKMEDSRIRVCALNSLLWLGRVSKHAPEVLSSLVTFMEVQELQNNVIEAVSTIGIERPENLRLIFDAFEKLASRKDWKIKRTIAYYSGKLGEVSTGELLARDLLMLMNLLKDESLDVQMEVLDSFNRIFSTMQRDLQNLVPISIDDWNFESVIEQIFKHLTSIAESVPEGILASVLIFLEGLATDDSDFIRCNLSYVFARLAMTRPEETLSASLQKLQILARDNVCDVQDAALSSLEWIAPTSPDSVLDVFQLLLETGNHQLKMALMSPLARIYEYQPQRVMLLLNKLCGELDPVVQKNANQLREMVTKRTGSAHDE